MNRLLGQTFAVVLIGTFATVIAPACADNDQTIFVRNALAPAQNRINNSCIYTGDPSQAFQSEGLVDIAIRDTYVAVLLVGNQMIARADANATRVEPNRVHINGAVVRVTDPNGGQLGEFTSLTSGLIDPEQSNQPSYTSTSVTVLDAKTTAALGAQVPAGQTSLVLSNIKVFGQTLGGVDVETAEFQYPIRICNGCLISFASGDDPTSPGKDCNLPLPTTGSTTQLPCAAGQDELTPCQLCSDRAACKGGP